ncbi:tetratricopeptide (TPR) repeat protein [Croceifilum oryzae]|uniref:Tetratricopeptide (TPR) repeat protein n=1 Tax=Croceifilum oryzae TaxID=1553429 RepID=A0AAJ1TL04_9BACL|nr:helix-turn-helix domain-containing protein [Croceifilum oryzae]MDQ0417936.1 tetratricopeptide (TPR) repeat protein [Croceifilum oryzae]
MEMRDYLDFGKYLRKARKSLGYTLDNLSKAAKEEISAATISNYERGIAGVSEDKIKLMCQPLEIDFSQYRNILKNEREQQDKWYKKLLGIEGLLDYLGANKAYTKLKTLTFDMDDPISGIHAYLIGRCYYHKKKWTKAREKFEEAINILKDHPDWDKSNIIPFCYKELGRIAYYHEGNAERAIHFNNLGIDSFIPEKERPGLIYVLLVTKAFYLEKMNENESATRTLSQLWKDIGKIDNIEVRINMFEIQALLFIKANFYDKAKEYAERGAELARTNKEIERGFELWITLGSLYMRSKQFEEAEEYFNLALEMKDSIKKEYLLISIHIQLGKLYMQQGKSDWAQEHIEKAVQIGENSNDEYRYIEALETFGDFHIYQGEIESAIIPYNKALVQAEKSKFPSLLKDTLVKLAYCYRSVGNIEAHRKCADKLLDYELELTLDSIIEKVEG